ncbi:MAG TPA: hypothetical protein VGH72_33605 [Pseudonocardia sp.]|jgi:hypothetical protein
MPDLDGVRSAFRVDIEPLRQAFRALGDAAMSVGHAVAEALADRDGLNAWTVAPERAELRQAVADSDEVVEVLRNEEPPAGMEWLRGIRAK